MRKDSVPDESACMPDARAVRGMFGRISGRYDFLNHFLSLGIDRSWRRALAVEVRTGPSGLVLDLAAGTLDVALAVQERLPGTGVLAMDFCLPMLERGLAKTGSRPIWPVAADATMLPLARNSVDCLTMAFGIRNIRPRGPAFAEMLRVLAPGGRACILEFGSGRDRIWGGLYNVYLDRILPLLGRLLSRDAAYAYLASSIDGFPRAVELEDEMREAGFARVRHQRLTGGIVCLHTGEKPL